MDLLRGGNEVRGAWWWIDRWQKSTAFKEMTLAEQGAYRNLLDELWLRDGILPNDERILGRLCGDTLEWEKVRPRVMAHFRLTPEGWRNDTHDEVRAESERRAEKQRRYRTKAGNVTGNAAGNARRNVTHSPSPSPSPSPSKDQSPISEEQNGFPSESLLGADAPPPSKPPRQVSERERLARALKKRIGCGLDRARDQVTACLENGLDLCAIDNAIQTHARGGMAPWDFTAAATGNAGRIPGKGLSAKDIFELSRRPSPNGKAISQ